MLGYHLDQLWNRGLHPRSHSAFDYTFCAVSILGFTVLMAVAAGAEPPHLLGPMVSHNAAGLSCAHISRCAQAGFMLQYPWKSTGLLHLSCLLPTMQLDTEANRVSEHSVVHKKGWSGFPCPHTHGFLGVGAVCRQGTSEIKPQQKDSVGWSSGGSMGTEEAGSWLATTGSPPPALGSVPWCFMRRCKSIFLRAGDWYFTFHSRGFHKTLKHDSSSLMQPVAPEAWWDVQRSCFCLASHVLVSNFPLSDSG